MAANIICLKWGTKYNNEHVNRLYKMVMKNVRQEINFYCCTENSDGLHSDIIPIELPEKYDLETYWWKLWITSDEFPVKGKCIFFDLDTVIQNDITEILEYDPVDKLNIVKAQWRYDKIVNKGHQMTMFNSSIMIWDNTRRTDMVFNHFMSDPEYYIHKYPGNDDYTESEFPNEISPLPLHWSYCRVWGYDDTDYHRLKHAPDRYIDLWNIRLQLYRMPDRMICMFNGIKDIEGIDHRIYEGFEHYWSD